MTVLGVLAVIWGTSLVVLVPIAWHELRKLAREPGGSGQDAGIHTIRRERPREIARPGPTSTQDGHRRAPDQAGAEALSHHARRPISHWR
jgi:hypothetical protein